MTDPIVDSVSTINTINTGEYSVVPSVFHYKEKEMNKRIMMRRILLEASASSGHPLKGILHELFEMIDKRYPEEKMPTPMTIEMEEQLTKTAQNVTCENLSNTDERQAALDAMPSLYGTPGTSAYNRSNELVAVWYDKNFATIRAALQSPRVPVIAGLDRAIKLFDEKSFGFEEYCILKAAKAYAELQKGA